MSRSFAFEREVGVILAVAIIINARSETWYTVWRCCHCHQKLREACDAVVCANGTQCAIADFFAKKNYMVSSSRYPTTIGFASISAVPIDLVRSGFDCTTLNGVCSRVQLSPAVMAQWLTRCAAEPNYADSIPAAESVFRMETKK